jgi:hypothetical protein
MGVRFTGEPLGGLFEDPEQSLPVTHVRQVPLDVLEKHWLAAKSAKTLMQRTVGGSPFLTVSHDSVVGWRIEATDHGVYVLSGDGRQVIGALPQNVDWTARRLVVSQLMPLAALIHGREVLHASAARIGGATIAIGAPSGTGKSSTLLQLIAGGAQLVADDHVALAPGPGQSVTYFAGPRLLNVSRDELTKFGPHARHRLGPELGCTDKVHLEPPPPQTRSGPLTHVAVLDRSRSFERSRVLPVEDPVREILGLAYAPHFAPPERMVRQLELLKSMLETVSIVRVQIGEQDGAAAVAAHLRSWLGETS